MEYIRISNDTPKYILNLAHFYNVWILQIDGTSVWGLVERDFLLATMDAESGTDAGCRWEAAHLSPCGPAQDRDVSTADGAPFPCRSAAIGGHSLSQRRHPERLERTPQSCLGSCARPALP
jgi:hypothetical protein